MQALIYYTLLHCSSRNQKGMHKTKKALHQWNTISTNLAKRDPHTHGPMLNNIRKNPPTLGGWGSTSPASKLRKTNSVAPAPR